MVRGQGRALGRRRVKLPNQPQGLPVGGERAPDTKPGLTERQDICVLMDTLRETGKTLSYLIFPLPLSNKASGRHSAMEWTVLI